MKSCEMHLKNETMAILNSYLVSRGIPMPPGAVRAPAGVSVRDHKGRILPSAGKILQRRPDGSIEWLLMDILVDMDGQENKSIFIAPEPAKPARIPHPVVVGKDRQSITLANGLSEIAVPLKGGSLVQRLVLNGKKIADENLPVDLQVVDGSGKIYRASLSGPYRVNVTHANPLCATVMVEGKHAARDKSTFLDFALRFTLTAGCPDLKLEHTFYCREPREGKLAVKAIRLILPTALDRGATKLLRQSNHGHSYAPRDVAIAENVEIVSSSVGDIDNYNLGVKGPSVSHPCAGGRVFIRDMDSLKENWSEYPFHMRPGQSSGFRADLSTGGLRAVHPVLGLKQKGYTLVTAFEHWRQLHPKSIAIDENLITYSIWPEWSIPMEIVQGVSKSHILWLTGKPRELDMDGVIDHMYRWEYYQSYVEPVDISFDPAWPAYCEVLDCQHLLKYQPYKYPLLENLIEPAPSSSNPARHTYDRQSAIGMFHFADIVNADATSCTNNEDDVQVFFPLQHFLRTGHTYAWDYGKEAARHYMEVDFCEWSADPRQRGGLIPHAGNHFIGCVYSSHQWAEGLLAYYYLSGDERARKVVIAVGDNHCYWVYNLTELVCSDGREAGMPLVNLAAAYRLTRDQKYIKAAKHIIKNFFLKLIRQYGEFKYPSPPLTEKHPHKFVTGYESNVWSSFAGLYRIWEVTGDKEVKSLAIRLLQQAIQPGSFTLNDARGMDFFAAWILGRLTGDMESVIKIVESAIPILLRRGGHPMRRMHFLKELDDRGLLNDKDVGNRAG